MRRLPQASRTRGRHAILLRTDRGEQRGHFDGPLPLWLHRGGLVYVIDFTPEHEGNEQVWVYRAVASTAQADSARAAGRSGWRRP
jgi:hypothetical protein